MWNDDVRWTTKQPFSYVQKWRFSLVAHTAWMPDETDAKISTASPLENWRRPPGYPRTIWMKIQQGLKSNTYPWMKQLMWLRIIYSGDWCLHLVLHTPSAACQKRRTTILRLLYETDSISVKHKLQNWPGILLQDAATSVSTIPSSVSEMCSRLMPSCYYWDPQTQYHSANQEAGSSRYPSLLHTLTQTNVNAENQSQSQCS